MKPSRTQGLVDKHGKPFGPRLQRALVDISPRFRKRFHALRDELLVTEILEEAGQRITDHEAASGPVTNLDAYAWVTVLNVTRSRLRRASMRLAKSTLGSDESEAAFDSLQATVGGARQIETDILVEEVLALLSPEERLLCALKQLGFSSREIAAKRRISVANVDTLFYRVKRKLRAALRGSEE